ncbi:MAG: PspC domain-containing protein [Bacillota bacterium]
MKRLYRSRRERMVAGVCGGVAQYFNVDVVIVRLAWVIFALAGGPGIIAYIIAWIIVPEEPAAPGTHVSVEGDTHAEPADIPSKNKSQKALGYILVALGLYILLRAVFPMPWSLSWGFSLGQWWPVILIALGVAMVLGFFDRGRSA